MGRSRCRRHLLAALQSLHGPNLEAAEELMCNLNLEVEAVVMPRCTSRYIR